MKVQNLRRIPVPAYPGNRVPGYPGMLLRCVTRCCARMSRTYNCTGVHQHVPGYPGRGIMIPGSDRVKNDQPAIIESVL
eukprot:1616308-Rhodomonas_salina.2